MCCPALIGGAVFCEQERTGRKCKYTWKVEKGNSIFVSMKAKTKSLKVTDWVHAELKMFAAKEQVPIVTISDAALVSLMTMRGHKFTLKPKKSQK